MSVCVLWLQPFVELPLTVLCLHTPPLPLPSSQTPRKLFMVMDFVAGGDFYARLSRDGSIGEVEAQLYMAELILALEHLHALGIVYRDLKPENVLIDGEGHVKLTDFGLSRCVPCVCVCVSLWVLECMYVCVCVAAGASVSALHDFACVCVCVCRFIVRRTMPDVGLAPAATPALGGPLTSVDIVTRSPDGLVLVGDSTDPASVITHTFCGTELYMAPEVLLQRGHSAAVDYWSLGECEWL